MLGEDRLDDGRALKCPFCGDLPYIGATEKNFWSRKRKTCGWRFSNYIVHYCKIHDRLYVEGKPSEIYANYNGGVSDDLYKKEDIYNARDEAETNAINKWNRLIKKVSKITKTTKTKNKHNKKGV